MMIKITGGVYGYRNERGSITYKTERDEPFALPPEEEKRLVNRGVAEYVGTDKVEVEPPTSEGNNEVPELSEKMKFAELKDIASEYYGLNCSSMRSKAEVIEAIQELSEQDEPEDDMPELGAAVPEA